MSTGVEPTPHDGRRRRVQRHPLAVRVAVTACSLLALTACGGESSTSVPTDGTGTPTTTPITTPITGDTVVMRYSLWGGCNMAGPNCPVYTVHADGTVEVGRNSQGAPSDPGTPVPTEVVGQIPADDVAAWIALVDEVDPDELLSELGPGECSSCVDGADILVIVHPGTDREMRLDSTVVHFDPAHPLFAALTALAAAFAEAAPLEVIWPEQTVTS